MPDCSPLSRRRKALKVNIPYRGSQGALHLLIDYIGTKIEGEGEWNARKHGGTKQRVWRKIHIGLDEQTREISSGCHRRSRIEPKMRCVNNRAAKRNCRASDSGRGTLTVSLPSSRFVLPS